MCLLVSELHEASVELFRGFNLRRLSVVNSAIPVISAISGRGGAGMHWGVALKNRPPAS